MVVHAQHKISVEDYILNYKDVAIDKMRVYGIPASITLAQGILESGSGNSELARKANNHFGIKCHKDWKGKTFHMDDDAKNECFRKYKSPDESYRDHSLFLTTRDRYADLFELDITDYRGWARGLKKAGYATNPKYPQLLIKIIEENRLYEFDIGITPDYLLATKSNLPVSSGTRPVIAAPPSNNYELVEIWETGRTMPRWCCCFGTHSSAVITPGTSSTGCSSRRRRVWRWRDIIPIARTRACWTWSTSYSS